MKIYSWGSNSHGQLGQGNEEEQILSPVPIDIVAVEPKLICGGGKHTILLTTTNEIFACGDNDKGQLGQETTIKLVNAFVHLSFQFKVAKIACGWDFNLVLTEDNQVFAWGSNTFGQLGLSVKKIKYLTAPHKILEKEVLSIGAGLRHSAIVTADGLIFTSGFGRKGQLGVLIDDRNPSVLDKFTEVKGIRNCKQISCGECHCVAITGNGEIFTWGNNKYGQLGLDPSATIFSATPVQIAPFIEVSINSNLYSGWSHNFILTDKGHLIAWGRNDFGQLGEQRQLSWKPELLKSLEKIKQICLGSHHSVALTENGEVLTWGWNEHGNCGNNNCSNCFQPYKLKGFSEVKLIGNGAAHSFLWSQYNKMDINLQTDILDIDNPNAEPTVANEVLTTIPVIDGDVNYSKFFELFLIPNRPCLIHNATKNWPCLTNWIKDNSLNVEYFRSNLKNIDVPISDCGKREYNVQKKCSMKLFDYLNYWEEYRKHQSGMDCLYLKDWHFMKDFPSEKVYRVPSFFASDWLNEYYDNNLHLKDDYRFVYIGPQGSWTPLHADVFTSYSWSVNVSGRKKWILFPPGEEDNFKDNLGNLVYNIDMSSLKKKVTEKRIMNLEVIQEEGQALFVPSGWHHQVWNLVDTISINHNWINGCNLHYIWSSLQKKLSDVMKEISDCKDMENWMLQCQLVLSASFGFNYQFFYSLLQETAKTRINALKANKNINVYGDWSFGENHMKFDLKRILTVLNWVEKDENFLEIVQVEDGLNHALEFMDSLSSFVNSKEF